MKLIKKIILICFVLTLITGTSITVYLNIFANAAQDVGTQIYETIPDETKDQAESALQELLDNISGYIQGE